MPEQYIATVMKAVKINDEDRVYIPVSITAGDINKKTNILTTYTGLKYKPISDYSELDSDITGYYFNIIEPEKVTEQFQGADSWEEACMAYEERSNQIFYYTSMHDGECVIQPIDRKKIAEVAEKMADLRGKEEIPFGSIVVEEDESDSDYFEDDDVEAAREAANEELIDLIKRVGEEVVLEDLTPPEIELIKSHMEEAQAAVEEVIDAADLRLEAMAEPSEEESTTTAKLSTPKPLLDGNKAKEENKSPLSNWQPIDIDSVFKNVTKTLIAQDEPARRAIIEISRLNDMKKRNRAILLTGNTGVGKTLLMSLISENIGRPYQEIDSSQITMPGYSGRSLEQYLWDLYESCGGNLESAENAIIYFDEIDKKGSSKKSDVSGQAVLNTLLKFIEGTDYIACKNPQQVTSDTSVKIKTNNMIVCVGGAFLDVYGTSRTKPIGFAPAQTQSTTKNDPPEISDFVTKGMMTNEFMGRSPVIIHLNDLDENSIKRIILESDSSELKLQEDVFALHGVKLSTKEGYADAIAKKAVAKKIGARGLATYIADSTADAYDTICCNPGKYSEVILTEETVSNPKQYQLVRKNQN